ncbi:MAG: RNA 2',3'-cyclic phosphodiesterase [Deltaproteobacteria bacterium]|nr:RNA 2',3'-cyclic phosphodiesterase [Deltaproteobacteria bacterium]
MAEEIPPDPPFSKGGRMFLAVDLDADVHARLVALKTDLARHGAAVRWVRDESLHATVKFLGSVSYPTLSALRDALTERLTHVAPLDATLAGLHVLPDARRPRIVCVGVDCPGLAAVAATADAVAATHGVAPESRPFLPHVTLGRVRETRGWAPLGAVLRARLTEVVGNDRFAALHAYCSDLRPGGAVYTKRWSIPFGA